MRAFDMLVALLFEADPIAINLVDNTDEYDPEVRTILPRLGACSSALDVQHVVHEEFTRWFGEAGPLEQYAGIARDVWTVWERGWLIDRCEERSSFQCRVRP